MASTRPIRVCRHEAAHAVVAWYFGYRVRRLRVMGPKRGCCETSTRRKIDPLAHAMVKFAGTAAENRWHRLALKHVEYGDHMGIVRLGFRGESLSVLAWNTRGLVNQLAPEIEAVAQALKRRDLTGRDVYRILREVRR